MTTFDFADTTQPCSQRNVSTVAPQALALLNNDFVHAQSSAFAARITADAGSDTPAQIERAWWLAFGRAPRESERTTALAHLTAQLKHFAAAPAPGGPALSEAEARRKALASLCHVLLNANEFVYVD
jgi:hypothetical protein